MEAKTKSILGYGLAFCILAGWTTLIIYAAFHLAMYIVG